MFKVFATPFNLILFTNITLPLAAGAEIDGQFNYDKAHICELKSEPGLEQDAYVMYADSPARIFVCPSNQIGIADKLSNQITNYAQLDPKMTGFGPGIGKLCLAKSNEDEAWYRGACLAQENQDHYKIFFVDYGFQVRIRTVWYFGHFMINSYN